MTTKTTAKYVDGFVLLVPKKNIVAYKKMAREGAKAWRQFGALDYMECMGDDLTIKPTEGMPVSLSFSKLTSAKPSDTVWFSFITFKNKKHRDQVNKKVMDYMSKKYADKKMEAMPFDVATMAYGGFSVQVS